MTTTYQQRRQQRKVARRRHRLNRKRHHRPARPCDLCNAPAMWTGTFAMPDDWPDLSFEVCDECATLDPSELSHLLKRRACVGY